MACKLCGRTAVYDLVCEKDGNKAAELCDGPMCQFDLWRLRPNEPRSCIPLMNGECTCGAALQQVRAGSGRLAYRFNNATRAVFRMGYHPVEAYSDGWEKHSQIVSDASSLLAEWQSVAKKQRGNEAWESSAPEDGKCSGQSWDSIDEGMDVAGEIADVDNNYNREGCTLWKASDYDSGQVIGILIMWDKDDLLSWGDLSGMAEVGGLEDFLRREKVWRGIRWLVGHPNVKGAGEALMAKVDELHRQSGHPYMSVIAASSSVLWYKSRGFCVLAPSRCEENGECGCQVMVKKLS